MTPDDGRTPHIIDIFEVHYAKGPKGQKELHLQKYVYSWLYDPLDNVQIFIFSQKFTTMIFQKEEYVYHLGPRTLGPGPRAQDFGGAPVPRRATPGSRRTLELFRTPIRVPTLALTGADDGCIDTVIRGIELIRAKPRLDGFPILLPKTIKRDDVPIGSTLNIVEDSPKDGVQNRSFFSPDDQVSVRANARNRTERSGTIERKVWHHKYQVWHYYIRDADGRPVTKRYTAADFIGDPHST